MAHATKLRPLIFPGFSIAVRTPFRSTLKSSSTSFAPIPNSDRLSFVYLIASPTYSAQGFDQMVTAAQLQIWAQEDPRPSCSNYAYPGFIQPYPDPQNSPLTVCIVGLMAIFYKCGVWGTGRKLVYRLHGFWVPAVLGWGVTRETWWKDVDGEVC